MSLAELSPEQTFAGKPASVTNIESTNRCTPTQASQDEVLHVALSVGAEQPP